MARVRAQNRDLYSIRVAILINGVSILKWARNVMLQNYDEKEDAEVPYHSLSPRSQMHLK